MFHCLGNVKPTGLESVETVIWNHIWMMAEGETTAEAAFQEILESVNSIRLEELDPGWFGVYYYYSFTVCLYIEPSFD
jgi:hypothetical protein